MFEMTKDWSWRGIFNEDFILLKLILYLEVMKCSANTSFSLDFLVEKSSFCSDFYDLLDEGIWRKFFSCVGSWGNRAEVLRRVRNNEWFVLTQEPENIFANAETNYKVRIFENFLCFTLAIV